MQWKEAKNHIKAMAKISKDGCSYAPEFTFAECCWAHDYHYKFHDISRNLADKKLRDCIKNHGYPKLAKVYYIFVRFFGQWAWEKSYNKKRKSK